MKFPLRAKCVVESAGSWKSRREHENTASSRLEKLLRPAGIKSLIKFYPPALNSMTVDVSSLSFTEGLSQSRNTVSRCEPCVLTQPLTLGSRPPQHSPGLTFANTLT